MADKGGGGIGEGISGGRGRGMGADLAEMLSPNVTTVSPNSQDCGGYLVGVPAP